MPGSKWFLSDNEFRLTDKGLYRRWITAVLLRNSDLKKGGVKLSSSLYTQAEDKALVKSQKL
jgi:hypothetical protein